jgi:hypothetical protein
MDEGYAVHIGGGRIRLFETNGNAFAGDIVLPTGLDGGVGFSRSLHAAAGTLALTFRNGDGHWGWLEATCGGE